MPRMRAMVSATAVARLSAIEGFRSAAVMRLLPRNSPMGAIIGVRHHALNGIGRPMARGPVRGRFGTEFARRWLFPPVSIQGFRPMHSSFQFASKTLYVIAAAVLVLLSLAMVGKIGRANV